MTQTPAGWYPEPDPAYADRPGRLRYWDGQRWTEHVHEPAAPPPPAVPPVVPQAPQPPDQGQAPAYPGYPAQGEAQPQYEPQPYQQYGQPAGQQTPYQPYGQQPYYQGYQQEPRGVTPDGVPLAGWWWRVLAKLLDAVISAPLWILASIPVLAWQWDSLSQWADDLSYAAQYNTPDPPTPAIFDPFTGPGIALSMSIFAAYLVYEVAFLYWKQATPGKLILGLRVRLREQPSLPSGAIWARVGFAVLGQLCGLLLLLDYLWPLWDSKKQALHDKVAKTNVVKPDPAAPVSAATAPPRW